MSDTKTIDVHPDRIRPGDIVTGRVHDVAEAERQAYVAETGWEPVLPDPYSVEYARALTGRGPEPVDIGEDDGVHREPISQPHRDCPVGTEAHEPHTFTAYNSGWRMVSCPGWTEEAEDDQPALVQLDRDEPEGEAYGTRCTSTHSGFRCSLPVHDGLHVSIETGDFWTDHGVLIKRPVWDDERHIWVAEHTPELPDRTSSQAGLAGLASLTRTTRNGEHP